MNGAIATLRSKKNPWMDGLINIGGLRVDRKSPATDQVDLSLRRSIIMCRLPNDAAIGENRKCSIFGVSRSPVRTALTRLVQDGLVDVFAQRGIFVSLIKLKQLKESRFVCTAIEISLVREAARYWSPAHRAIAEANIQLQRQHPLQGETS